MKNKTIKGNGLLFKKILFNSLGFITIVALSLGISIMTFSGQILKSQITKSSGEYLRQIIYNLDQVFSFIDSSAISLGTNALVDITLKSSAKPIDKFSDYQDIMEMMWTIKNTNKYIHSVLLYLEKDGKVISSQGSITDIDRYGTQPWINVYRQKQNAFIDTYSMYDDSLGKSVNIMSIVKSLPLSNNNLKHGALIINLDAVQVNSIINNDRIRKNEQILIIDGDGAVISSENDDVLYKTFPWSEVVSKREGTTGTYRTTVNGEDSFIIYHSMPKYNWKVASIIPSSDLFSELYSLLLFTTVIIILGLLLFFPIVGFFSKKMYNPIQKLVDLLSKEYAGSNSFMKDDINFINQSIEGLLKDRTTTYQLLEKIKPLAHEKYIKILLTGDLNEQPLNTAYMQNLGINFGQDYFTVVVIEVDNSLKKYNTSVNAVQNSFMSNFKDSLKSYIEQSGYANYIMETENFRLSVIINSNSDEQKDIDNIYIMCLELKDYIARENNYTITLGIGNTMKDITMIKTSYQQAVFAIEQKLVMGKNRVIRVSDIQDSSDKSFYKKDFIESIIKKVRELDMDGAIKTIHETTDLIISEKVDSRNLHKFFYSLLNIITYTISDMGVNTELIFSSSSDLIDDFLQNEDVEDIKKWFSNIFKRLEEAIALKESNAPNIIINRVKEYILNNYTSDISLSNIADVVYLHPHYLGKLFKKYEGITITEYLTCVRMERAKELLKCSTVKISEISNLVGISSPQYFIHCFKNYQGVTPKGFREMNRG